jgi:uncharacterized protein YhaN
LYLQSQSFFVLFYFISFCFLLAKPQLIHSFSITQCTRTYARRTDKEERRQKLREAEAEKNNAVEERRKAEEEEASKREAEAEEAEKNAEDEQRKKAKAEKKRLEDERMKEVEKKRLEDEQRKKDEDERAKAAAGCNPVILPTFFAVGLHLQLQFVSFFAIFI